MIYIEHNYEELYDLVHDPHETINLINDDTYKKNWKNYVKDTKS